MTDRPGKKAAYIVDVNPLRTVQANYAQVYASKNIDETQEIMEKKEGDDENMESKEPPMDRRDPQSYLNIEDGLGYVGSQYYTGDHEIMKVNADIMEQAKLSI